MNNNIKWIENKDDDFRGNHSSFVFKVDNSSHILAFRNLMTYKVFKSSVREFAQKFGCRKVEILNAYKNQYTMTICDGYEDGGYKFMLDIPVKEGERRQFIYFDIENIFEDNNFSVANNFIMKCPKCGSKSYNRKEGHCFECSYQSIREI